MEREGGGETNDYEVFEVARFEELDDVREDGVVSYGEQRLGDVLPLEKDQVNRREGGGGMGIRRGRGGDDGKGPWIQEGELFENAGGEHDNLEIHPA